MLFFFFLLSFVAFLLIGNRLAYCALLFEVNEEYKHSLMQVTWLVTFLSAFQQHKHALHYELFYSCSIPSWQHKIVMTNLCIQSLMPNFLCLFENVQKQLLTGYIGKCTLRSPHYSSFVHKVKRSITLDSPPTETENYFETCTLVTQQLLTTYFKRFRKVGFQCEI